MKSKTATPPLPGDAPSTFKWVVALLFLHVVTSIRFSWDEMDFLSESLIRINPDLMLLLAGGSLITLVVGRRAIVDHLLTIAVIFVPLYRFGYSLMPAFYGKDFDPYHDALLTPALIHLLTQDLPDSIRPWVTGVALILTALIAAGIYTLIFLAWRQEMRLIAAKRQLALPVTILGGAAFAVSTFLNEPRWPLNDSMLTKAATYTADLWSEERWQIERHFREFEALSQERMEGVKPNVAGLKGADVYVLFLESYGRAVLGSESSRTAYNAWCEDFTNQIHEAGFTAASRFMFPSIRGGQSLLAHAEFLCGIEVENRRIFDMLLESDQIALPKTFAEAGYETINVQPAMTIRWPASKVFFGFTRDRFNDSLPYDGPWFPWGFMPDQYALQLILDSEVSNAESPLFVQYIGVTSHAPYSRTPRYYKNWEDTQITGAYDYGTDSKVFDIGWHNYVGHPEVEEAYLATIEYCLQTTIGLLGELDRRSMVIVIGDHQPPSLVRKLSAGQKPSKDVMCHIMSNDPDLMTPLRDHGFAAGLMPTEDSPSLSFAEFRSLFLRCYGR